MQSAPNLGGRAAPRIHDYSQHFFLFPYESAPSAPSAPSPRRFSRIVASIRFPLLFANRSGGGGGLSRRIRAVHSAKILYSGVLVFVIVVAEADAAPSSPFFHSALSQPRAFDEPTGTV